MIDISDFRSIESVIRFFEEISRVPRGSGNREPIADYLVNFAKERGLEYTRDAACNVIIRKPATAGYEKSPAIILQGHTDMVIAKNSECQQDVETEGVRIYRDGDLLRAVGTTLGGDDGVAVAYALAILDSHVIEHPLIEAIFTSDEEIGLLGATALEGCETLRGNMLINIDSDVEGIFTAGCAGGVRTDIVMPVSREEYCGERYRLTVSGLLGGHSGMEIDKGRENANKILGEVLSLLLDLTDFRIICAKGGNADNAIPREATCLLASKSDISEIVRKIGGELLKKYGKAEPDMKISAERCDALGVALSLKSTKSVINLISALPSGVMAMSSDILGLVETSLNMGILELDENSVRITHSVRSAKGKEKRALCDRLKGIAEEYGASYSEHGEYAAWEYRKESPLRDVMCRVYREMYGKDAEVVTIHAGLECGILSEKIKNLDCVSIGPDNFDIHTTEERLSLSSVERVYQFILNVLKAFK